MQEICAKTQYQDLVGNVVADCSDHIASISHYMEERRLIGQEEFVIAIDLYVNQGGSPIVNAIVAPVEGYDSVPAWLAANADPLPARKVSMELSIEEFFSLFKRFNVVMAPKGLNVLGRRIQD